MTEMYRRTEKGKRIEARLLNVAPDDYGTTIISFEEQTRGWLDSLNKRKKEGNLVSAYESLEQMRLMYQRFAVWQYNTQADTIHGSLIRAKIRMGPQDRRIAAIALATGAVVLTGNRRHFDPVVGLAVDDWTV